MTNIDKFGASLQQWFHRRVPIWVTEWAEQTAPEYSQGGGISHAQQATDVKTALQLAQASPYVEMFIWFVFRDSTDKTWFSGIENKTGARKPAYSAFATAAKAIDGQIDRGRAEPHRSRPRSPCPCSPTTTRRARPSV